jgi:two-component system LytT family sensor kinase
VNSAPANRRRRLRFFFLWTVIGLFFGTKRIIEAHLYGQQNSWAKALWWQLLEWYSWGLLALIAFRVCRECERRRASWGMRVFIQGSLGAALALAQGAMVSLGAEVEAWVLNWPTMANGQPWSLAMVAKLTVVNHFHFNLLVYGSILGAWYAVSYYERARERELRAVELEGQLAQAQLQVLRAQLHPHFLFNTLNTIAEMIHDSPQKAEEMIVQLGELLRVVLQSQSAQEVTLADEIAFVRRYLEIEQVRFGERLQVEWAVAHDTWPARVPNMILHPLVENAIRHGIAPFTKAGRVLIRAERTEGNLCLEIHDSGSNTGASSPNKGHGIGLSNTRTRLQRFYGDRQRFELRQDDGTVASLTIPFLTTDKCNTGL